MVRFVILDPVRERGFLLKNMILSLDDVLPLNRVEIVTSPRELYEVCQAEPADLIFATPSILEEEAEAEDDFHQVLDDLRTQYPWIQILLVLEEKVESIRMLRKRDERFLFRPYQRSSVERIIQESLAMGRQIRHDLYFQEQAAKEAEKEQGAQSRFLGLVESRETTAVLRRELDVLGMTFGWGFAAVVEEGKEEGGLRRVHEGFLQKGYRIFEGETEEGRVVLIMGEKVPSSGLAWQKQVLLDEYTRQLVPVYGAEITESLSQLGSLMVEAKKKYVSHEPYTPILWTQQHDVEHLAKEWALAVALSNLTERREDLLALNRHLAHEAAGMSTREQFVLLQIARLTLEEQVNRLYDLQRDRLELPRAEEGDEPMDEKKLFSWFLRWSDQACMTADVYASQSHVVYLTQIHKAICRHFQERDFNLETLSAMLGLSTGYICSLMKKYTPYSFVDFLNQCRVYYAMALLETDLLIKNVASESGFQSSTYLGRVFKNITGETPGEYRRKHQKTRQKPQKLQIPPAGSR